MSNARRPHRTRSSHTVVHNDRGLARRLDALDEKIWCAARATDDPHLTVRAARDFAESAFLAVVIGAGSGQHRVNCAVATGSGTIAAPENLPVSVMGDLRAIALPHSRGDHEICELLALAHAAGHPALLVLRSSALVGPPLEHSEDIRVRGWRVEQGRCEPLDATAMFAASFREPIASEVLPLSPATHYEDAFPLVRIPRQLRDEGPPVPL